MSTAPYRVGLVGTGGIARAHGAACQSLDGVELVAICDISQSALDRFGDEFSVSQRYLDLNQMLNKAELDIAIISNWGVHHAQTGIQIARSERVKAILCEKPFTSNAAEAQRLVKAAQEHDILLAEAFKFRHHPMHLKAKELLDNGTIGEVMTLRSTFCTGGNGAGPETRRPESNWRFNKAQGGGSIFDLACYNLHHARFVFGAEPLRLYASQQPGIEVDDGASILLEFPGEKTAQISVGFNSWNSQYAEICGTGGMIRLDKVWNNENQPTALELRTPPTDRQTPEVFNFAPVNQFALQLQHLCDCLTHGTPHRIPPQNSIAQMHVIDAVYESMMTKKVVEIRYGLYRG
ncbi:MAG: Gfo/Idh/MocA family oxidoreductase [Caldilineaceae bacterium]